MTSHTSYVIQPLLQLPLAPAMPFNMSIQQEGCSRQASCARGLSDGFSLDSMPLHAAWKGFPAAGLLSTFDVDQELLPAEGHGRVWGGVGDLREHHR